MTSCDGSEIPGLDDPRPAGTSENSSEGPGQEIPGVSPIPSPRTESPGGPYLDLAVEAEIEELTTGGYADSDRRLALLRTLPEDDVAAVRALLTYDWKSDSARRNFETAAAQYGVEVTPTP
jgi:hypothetical protein